MSTVVHAAAHHAVRHLRDTFIPHEGNGHRPHVVSHRSLLWYSAMLIVIKGLAVAGTIALPSASLYSSSITGENIVTLTNAARHNLNLSKLEESATLNRAAQAKAEDMIAKQYFAHQSPDGDTPWDWFRRAGYSYLYAGENLAVHYTTAEEVGEGWMASPSHRANIVNPSYTQIGVGIAYGTFEGVPSHVVVQMFGSPIPVAAVAPTPARNPAPDRAPTPKPTAPAAVPTSDLPPTGEVASAAVKPAPIAAPAASEPVAETTLPTVGPTVDPASLQLRQHTSSYEVSLSVEDAAAVELQLGGLRVPLARIGQTDTWDGVVPFDLSTMNAGGEQLTVTAVSQSGSTISQVVAWVAPAAQPQQLYNFNGGTQRAIKLLGVTVQNLNDSTRQVYLYFVIFLAVAMLLNVAIKFRVQHPSIIGHGAAVMALAVILFLV